MNSFNWRWIAVAVFIFSSTLNYLDRSLLNVLAPWLMKEFSLNQQSFGYVISVFSIVYACSSLGAGLLLDRIGLNKSISAAVAWWSTVSIGTALTHGFGGLLGVRAALGLGESAGVPAFGKLNGIYLKPSERALGTAANQVGLSLGGITAAAAVPITIAYGWRMPFAICGALGLLWLPIWLWVSKKIPPEFGSKELATANERTIKHSMALWGSRDLWLVVVATLLWMPLYSLWGNWTTLYLTKVLHVAKEETARYIWIPPLVSTLGGFFGGWMSMWWMNRKVDSVNARRRAIWVSAIGALLTLTLPLATSAVMATAIISASVFFCLAGSVNLYALPLDIFGGKNAGMTIGALTFAYGLLQTVISPLIGRMADHGMYSQVIWILTLPLLASAAVLMFCSGRRE